MVSDRPGGSGGLDIYVARRARIGDAWGPLQNLGPKINSSANDYCPFVTPDGSRLLFLSNRPGGQGLGDFYIAFRQNIADDLAWDNVQPIGELNTASDEFGPSGFEDPVTGELTIFFNSDRPGGSGGPDIYTSRVGPDGKFSPPQVVSELSSASGDTWPVVSADGLEILFISNRPGTIGGNDIWISSRGSTSDVWSTPVNLGPTVNTASVEGRAWFYGGGTRIVFFSNRAGGIGGQDLYETTRTRANVVPVVGSVTGIGGIRYTTVAQITNPSASPITGSLIFRPAGQQSAASDARISYSLGPFETRAFADLMAAFGTSGLGSLDIVTATGVAPVVTAHIQNGGVVAVPQLRSEDVLLAGTRGVLAAPSDAAQFRFNIGVRTFAAGVSMTISVYDAAGGAVRSTTRTFPPNFFTQMPAAEFAGGAVGAGHVIVVSIDSGSAALYGSSASNIGRGSTLQIARRAE